MFVSEKAKQELSPGQECQAGSPPAASEIDFLFSTAPLGVGWASFEVLIEKLVHLELQLRKPPSGTGSKLALAR